jgi:hypothetical protein
LLERSSLLGAVTPPKWNEPEFPGDRIDEAEEIFEAAIEERVAFHVEEQVALAGTRETPKSLAGNQVEQFTAVLAIGSFCCLEASLAIQALQRVRLEVGYPSGRREGC